MPSSISKELISPNGSLLPLGVMAGSQVRPGKNGSSTYSRHYSTSFGSDELRADIQAAMERSMVGDGIKAIGAAYSYTPPILSDGRRFGVKPSTYQGGGFFLTLGEVEESKKRMTSLEYVTLALRDQLEAISGVSAEELYLQFSAYGESYFLSRFFDPVDLPREGDMVIYEGTNEYPAHYGVFRESKSNWLSPEGGTVESKWNWFRSPYVFQHDLFFVPPFFGNNARFYRVKDQPVEVDHLAIQPHSADTSFALPSLSCNQSYTVQEDGSLTFNRSEANLLRRQTVDQYDSPNLAHLIPEIEFRTDIKFSGVCYDYAFGRVLSTYDVCTEIPNPGMHGKEILEKYFTVTTQPQKGDLVVYYKSGSITHWGLYLEDQKVESKWGSGSVCQHSIFDAPIEYGDTVRIFRLRDGLTASTLATNLREDKRNSLR